MPGSPPTLPGTATPLPRTGPGGHSVRRQGFGEPVKLFSKSSKSVVWLSGQGGNR